MSNKWYKGKIVACSNPDFWYADMIGATVMFQFPEWPSAYVTASTGDSVLKYDLEYELGK